jgi:hypothetical protein
MKFRHPSNCAASALAFLAFASIGYSSPARAGWVYCAGENQVCLTPLDNQPIRFGANDRYVTLTFLRGAVCSIRVFGDPFPNATKQTGADSHHFRASR